MKFVLTSVGILVFLLFVPNVRSQDSSQIDEDRALAVLQKAEADDATLFEKGAACRRLAVIGTEKSVPALIELLENERLDTEARTSLENIPSPEVAQHLREALLRELLASSTGRKRVNIIRTLGNLRDDKSVAEIRPLVQDDDRETVLAAIAALGRIASPGTASVLRHTLDAKNDEIYSAAVDALLDVCGQILDANDEKRFDVVVVSVEKLKSDPRLPVPYRKAANRALVLASGSKGTQTVLDFLVSETDGDFQSALEIAREYGTRKYDAEHFIEKYVEFLPQLGPERRAAALAVLEERNDVGELSPTVLQNAGKGSKTATLAVLAVMGRHGNRDCAEILLRTLSDEDADIAKAARNALARFKGREIDAEIVKLLGSEVERIRLDAVVLVGLRQIAEARDVIYDLAIDAKQPEALRIASIETLGSVAPPEMLSKLVVSLNGTSDDRFKPAWKQALRDTVVRAPDRDRCVELLLACWGETTTETKAFLLELFPSIGGRKALETLLEIGKNDSAHGLHDNATKALGQWIGADAAPYLLELTTWYKDKHVPYHQRTLRGLIRVLRQFDMPRNDRLDIARKAREIADRAEEQNMLDEIIARWTPKPVSIFDGKTFDGWEGDTQKSFRIEDGAVVGGNLKENIPRNEFLTTKKSYQNFVLTLECKAIGEGCNGGIQIRSRRIPNHHEMIGYQADMDRSGSIWGNLYDESRRNKNLAEPDRDELMKVFKKDDWNRYEIRCEGKRIRLFVNGLMTVDYTEEDGSLEQKGLIGLQIHGGPPSETRYRNIVIEELD